MLNALSIDLEDWFHAELVRTHTTERTCGGAELERRVAWAAEPVLTLLERYAVHATFFVVGDVLRQHPDLVRRIHAAGHEIGCHGWSHRPLWTLEPERFAQELDEFDRDTRGVVPPDEIIGFRAPTFSLDERTAWAVDILREHGYRYDSSIFPVRRLYVRRGRLPAPALSPDARRADDCSRAGRLLEFPMTAYRLLGFDIPVSGGFYLRALPLAILRTLLRSVNAAGQPVRHLPAPLGGRCRNATRDGPRAGARAGHLLPCSLGAAKLEALLQTFRFAPLRDVFACEAAARLPARARMTIGGRMGRWQSQRRSGGYAGWPWRCWPCWWPWTWRASWRITNHHDLDVFTLAAQRLRGRAGHLCRRRAVPGGHRVRHVQHAGRLGRLALMPIRR